MIEMSRSTKILNSMYIYKRALRSLTPYQGRDTPRNTDLNSEFPLQILLPTGAQEIGLRSFSSGTNDLAVPLTQSQGYIVSAPPEFLAYDTGKIQVLVASFTLFFICNIICMTLMFLNARNLDTSLVENRIDLPPYDLQRVSPTRNSDEYVYFQTTLVILCFGEISVLLRSSFGITLFIASTILNFCVSFPYVPCSFYLIRFIPDCIMLRLALSIRYILVVNFIHTRSSNH